MKKCKRIFSLFLLTFATISMVAQDNETHWVDSVFNSLTVGQRVGQLMNVRVNQPNKQYDTRIDEYIKDYNLGGVTFFRTDAEPLLIQSNKWQSMAQTPLMVAIDGEWGLGMRINDAISYPYQMTLGAIQNDSLIAEMGRQIAEQCKRMGISINFAPDVDVNNEPANPVIGVRSFGEDPFAVARKGAAYALALQKNGIMPSMKHFPGHGNTHTDSHETLPKVDKSLEEIQNVELYPFRYLIGRGVEGAMVGHLYLPAIEPVANTSSSLSKNVITGLLKEKMGFKGLIFTDALDMKGASKTIHPDSVSYYALMAGNDVLLLPLDAEKSIEIIINAAENNEAVAQRVNESCKKILTYKYRLGLADYKPQSEEHLLNDLQQERYHRFKQLLYNEAVTMIKNKNHILPMELADDETVAVVTFGEDANMSRELRKRGIINTSFVLDKNIKNGVAKETLKKLKDFDYIIVNIQNTSILATRNFGITAEMKSFIEKLSKQNHIIFNLFACPYALNKFEFKKEPAAILIAYEDKQEAVNAVADIIVGLSMPKGKLPVTISKKYPLNFGLNFESFLSPESLQVELIDNKYIKAVDSIVLDGMAQKAFPGCQIVALKDGKVIYDKCFGNFTYDESHPVQEDDVYDIASLTKIFASTFALMKLYDEHLIDLESTLGDFFPFLKDSDKGDIKLIEFLTHQSGLTPWIPIYKETLSDKGINMDYYRPAMDEDFSIRVAKDLYLKNDFKYRIYDTIMKSELKEKKYIYSDIGFYFVPDIVEMITNQPFEKFLCDNYYKPMNLNHVFYKPLKYVELSKIAPTENDTIFRKQLICGDVHDQTAALFGGVSGHAGLFANAKDLAVMMQFLLDEGELNEKQVLKKNTIELFTSAPFAENENRRGIGFDKPDLDPAAKYYTPSKQSSMKSFGHSGFTGSFAWADPENNLVVVFLSNRVYPSAENNLLSKLDIRTKIHDMFYNAVK